MKEDYYWDMNYFNSNLLIQTSVYLASTAGFVKMAIFGDCLENNPQ